MPSDRPWRICLKAGSATTRLPAAATPRGTRSAGWTATRGRRWTSPGCADSWATCTGRRRKLKGLGFRIHNSRQAMAISRSCSVCLTSAMRISGIEFPKPLLDAVRNKRLVIFAGAGVSVAQPAGLPTFRQLAKAVAIGTGEILADSFTKGNKFISRSHSCSGRITPGQPICTTTCYASFPGRTP